MHPGAEGGEGRTTEKGRGWGEWGEWQERGEVERQRCRPPEPRQDCLSGDSRKKSQAELCRKIFTLQEWMRSRSEPRLGEE